MKKIIAILLMLVPMTGYSGETTLRDLPEHKENMRLHSINWNKAKTDAEREIEVERFEKRRLEIMEARGYDISPEPNWSPELKARAEAIMEGINLLQEAGLLNLKSKKRAAERRNQPFLVYGAEITEEDLKSLYDAQTNGDVETLKILIEALSRQRQEYSNLYSSGTP